ncbi:hypothetical protein JOC95_001290 [Bacillus tianshenii]|uniref:Uncharacterized protein n=1 Tax=Sutcliffiella tianshenii TaxID=1463404 RepID=A0ABS2NXP2_9BACI|nr:hypothetical protein [Bacillus tianshenii]MBM7619441.1 hypothetical protein [Bacillus tianshenii]
MGDPTGEAEEAPIRPRGKQVSAAEINGLHLLFTFSLYSDNECEKSQKEKPIAGDLKI